MTRKTKIIHLNDLMVVDDLILTLFKLKLAPGPQQHWCINCVTLMNNTGDFCSVRCKMEHYD